MSSRARIIFTYRLTPYYGKAAITFLQRSNPVLAREIRKKKNPWKWKEAWKQTPHLHGQDIFKVFLEPKSCNRRRSLFYAELKKLGVTFRSKRVKKLPMPDLPPHRATPRPIRDPVEQNWTMPAARPRATFPEEL